ncbi:hypothetical protein GCM10028783_16640 [Modestobacter muralis]
MSTAVTLRRAAVLVLLADGRSRPTVLLTERSPDLADHPGQLVFPGGAADTGDDGPCDTALRGPREEIGPDPVGVRVIGQLPPMALADSGFLVTPVLAWTLEAPALDQMNPAEVSAVLQVPLPGRRRVADDVRSPTGPAAPARPGYGRMTETVLDLLASMIGGDWARARRWRGVPLRWWMSSSGAADGPASVRRVPRSPRCGRRVIAQRAAMTVLPGENGGGGEKSWRGRRSARQPRPPP